jgi:hypothetical protein
MKVTRVEQQQTAHRAEQTRLQDQRNEQYRVRVEQKKFDDIVAERVNRARRLGSDKGQNIDLEC